MIKSFLFWLLRSVRALALYLLYWIAILSAGLVLGYILFLLFMFIMTGG